MATETRNRAVIVTGGGSGIGRATAVLFARNGAGVVIADMAPAASEETVKTIVEGGGKAVFVQTDVSDPQSVDRMVRSTTNEYGRVDVLVNCAGVLATGPLVETDVETWDRVMSVNLKGTFLCCRAVATVMLAQGGGGAIVNIASESGILGVPNLSAYCTSKAGVLMFTKAVAVELAPKGIRVCSISPTATYTPMHAVALDRLPKEEAQRRYERKAQTVPMGRWGQPEDIAQAVFFLASEEASFITGVDLPVDGGVTSAISWYQSMLKR